MQKSRIKIVHNNNNNNNNNNNTLICMFTPNIFRNTSWMSLVLPWAGSLVRNISFGEWHNLSRRHSSACVKSCESSTYISCMIHGISFSSRNLKVFHFYFSMKNMKASDLRAHLINISYNKQALEKIHNYVLSLNQHIF